MKIISEILGNWTHYELRMVMISILAISILGLLSTLIFIKDKRSLLFSLTSSVSTMVIVGLTVFFLSILIADISNVYSFVFLITTTISAANTITLNNFLLKSKASKDFDIDTVTREHFSDSLKLISFICLFFTILAVFTYGDVRNVFIASGISTVVSVFVNHLLSRLFFKDKNEK